MKTLYLECNMGAAGDMVMSALCELAGDAEGFVRQMNGLGIPGVQVACERVEKCGVMGTHMRVTVHGAEEESRDAHGRHGEHQEEAAHAHGHDHEHGHGHEHGHEHEHRHEQGHDHGHQHAHHHSHNTLAGILGLIDNLPVSEKVRADAAAVYRLLAEAESHAHGVTMDEIHFHELGTMDAVADIVGTCLLMEKLAPDKVVSSPVHVGCGHVHCAHGVLPVPAPATARILRGVPIYGGEVQGELCTPTGAALVKYFAQSYGPMPVMAPEGVGYGMGVKDFGRLSCVRAFLGEEAQEAGPAVQLWCTARCTGEELAFAAGELAALGAAEVTVQAAVANGRPGHVVRCVCRPEDARTVATALRAHTGASSIYCNKMEIC